MNCHSIANSRPTRTGRGNTSGYYSPNSIPSKSHSLFVRFPTRTNSVHDLSDDCPANRHCCLSYHCVLYHVRYEPRRNEGGRLSLHRTRIAAI